MQNRAPAKQSAARGCAAGSRVSQPLLLALCYQQKLQGHQKIAIRWLLLGAGCCGCRGDVLWLSVGMHCGCPWGCTAAVHGVVIQAPVLSTCRQPPPLPVTRACSSGACFGCCCSSRGFWAASRASTLPGSAGCSRERELPEGAQQAAGAGGERERSHF